MALAVAATLVASAATLLSAAPAFAVPGNDDFANARAIAATASGTATGTNVDATKEDAEPDHAGNPGGASVWFKWTAPTAEDVIFDTCGSTFDTVLAVYTGTDLASLTEEASNDDGKCAPQSDVSFTAVAGTVYYIAVDGSFGDQGSIALTWGPPDTTPPANDNFADAQLLVGKTGSVTGSNDAATEEAGEPEHFAGIPPTASVWYRWTAAITGRASFNTCGSTFDTVLAVYTGTAVDALTQVASNDDDPGLACGGTTQSAVAFTAVAGTSYHIAVASFGNDPSSTGRVTLSWALKASTVVADFNGNGTTDVSVFRPSSGVWFVNGGVTVGWGTSGDVPVPGDYNGDGTTDIAVFRPSTGTWFVRNGITVAWGTSGDIPVPGDYNGDGTTDIAVFRPGSGVWFVRNGVTVAWGTSGDVPLPLPPAIKTIVFPAL